MAITSVSAPNPVVIDGVSTGTNSTGTITIVGTAGTFWKASLVVTGNLAGAILLFSGYKSTSSWTTSASPTDDTLLTKLEGATAFSWYVYVENFNTGADYVNSVPTGGTKSSASSTLTISGDASATRVSNVSFTNISSSTPLNLDLASPSFTYTFTEPSNHAGWRTTIDFRLRNSAGTNSALITQGINMSTGGSRTVTLTTEQVTLMRNAMLNVSPATLWMRAYTRWRRGDGSVTTINTTNFDSITNNTAATFAATVPYNMGASGYYFTKTGWTNSYYYLVSKPGIINSNGTYNMDLEVYLYNTGAINSALVASATINGQAASIKSGFTSPSVISTTGFSLLGTFTISNIGPFNTRRPAVPVTVSINFTGTTGPGGPISTGTVNTPTYPAAGSLPEILALDEGSLTPNPTVTNTAIGSQIASAQLIDDAYSFYKIRITDLNNNVSQGDSNPFGTSAFSYTWTGRLPATTYNYQFSIIGRDSTNYGSKQVALKSFDNAPIINSITVYPDASSGKTQSSVTVQISTSGNIEPIKKYVYFYKQSSSGTWLGNVESTSQFYTYSGLASNTTYDFRVIVYNTNDVTTDSNAVGKNLTTSTLAVPPQYASPGYTVVSKTDTSIQLKINGIVDTGLTAQYSFGRRLTVSPETWSWTSWQSSDTYTFSPLSSGEYTFDFNIKDSLGTTTKYSSVPGNAVQKISTYLARPLLNSISTTLKPNSAIIKLSTTPTAAISSYKYKYYKSGDPVPGSWITTQSGTYSITNLLPGETYFVIAELIDEQGLSNVSTWQTGVAYRANAMVDRGGIWYQCKIAHTSGTFATDLAAGKWEAFTFSFVTPLEVPATNAQFAKLIRTTSTNLNPAAANYVPIRDGNFIVATDNGNIYLDTVVGGIPTRNVISYGIKVYSAAVSTNALTFTTNDFRAIDLSSNVLTFYIKPQVSTVTPASITLQINDSSGTFLGPISIVQADGDALTNNLLQDKMYMVTYNSTSPAKFVLINTI